MSRLSCVAVFPGCSASNRPQARLARPRTLRYAMPLARFRRLLIRAPHLPHLRMAQLPIVHWPHKALSTPAAPVEHFDEALHRFIDDMAETMYAAGGVGLAANQVDRLVRVTVMDCAVEDEPSQLLELVNPTVVEQEGSLVWEEGCLSFPGLYNDVKRAARVRVKYQDRHGEEREVEGEGLLAICLQHEIDHLDGKVFIDRIGPLARRMALKQWKRIAEEIERTGSPPERRQERRQEQ